MKPILSAAVTFALLISPQAFADAPSTQPDGYTLVWADEFNTDGPLNSADWNYEKGFVRNNELQWYQPDNAICHNGLLIIEARREHKPNPTYVAGSKEWRTSREFIEYTAASVNTARKHTYQYGRFEIRARINTDLGSWPAFWTLGTHGGWPGNGEIDIMEYYRHMLLANIAWQGAVTTGGPAVWNSTHTPLSKLGADWSSQFHTWDMDWDENSVKLYCDKTLLNSQDLAKTLNDPKIVGRRGTPANPFHQEHYILLNQAIGGQQGGDPSKTTFPLHYEIDYVRIYQTAAQRGK